MNKRTEALRVLADGYVLDNEAGCEGTSGAGEVQATYAQLVTIIGEPNDAGEGYKVSTIWVLRGPNGVVTLYDYKATNLYESDLPSPEELRASTRPRTWYIGAFSRKFGHEFQEWLMNEIMMRDASGMRRRVQRER